MLCVTKKLKSSKVKTFIITSSSPMDDIIRNLHLEQKSFFLLYLDYKSGRKKNLFPLKTHTWLKKNILAKLMTNIHKAWN